MARCFSCRCTDEAACEGGCSWLAIDYTGNVGVCSSCADSVARAESMLRNYMARMKLKQVRK